jgi:hypothetical protein
LKTRSKHYIIPIISASGRKILHEHTKSSRSPIFKSSLSPWSTVVPLTNMGFKTGEEFREVSQDSRDSTEIEESSLLPPRGFASRVKTLRSRVTSWSAPGFVLPWIVNACLLVALVYIYNTHHIGTQCHAHKDNVEFYCKHST